MNAVNNQIPSASDNIEMTSSMRRNGQLGYWSVIAIIFFSVCGGPFGIEDTVRYGGPRLALLGLLILPWIWSVPEALVTAELGTMFPDDSGTVAWITAAFGPFWGFQRGFLSWIGGVIDNSVYPIFMTRYLQWFFPDLNQNIPQKVFLIVVSVALTYMNYRGLKVVGRASVFLTIFVICPFVVLWIFGYDQVDTSNWTISHPDRGQKDFYAYLNVMFWNLNYWDSVASLSGEIGDINSVLPKALLSAVILVAASYFFPVLLGIGVVGGNVWPEGFFGYLGQRVGGVWLKGWIILAAVASQVGLFTAELSSDAYLLLGLAEKGMLPKILACKSKYSTPTLALLLSCSGVIIMLVSFDFVSIIEMMNSTYCVSMLLEFSAIVYLRYQAPEYTRPFKIPISAYGLILILLPATLLVLILLAAPFYFEEWNVVIFTTGAIVVGIVLYNLLEYLRSKKLVRFNKMDLATLCVHDNPFTYKPVTQMQSFAEF